jgi:hypothetical protein
MHVEMQEPEFTIETNIPCPRRDEVGRFAFLKKMKVGNSFFVPFDHPDVTDMVLYKQAKKYKIHIRIVGIDGV